MNAADRILVVVRLDDTLTGMSVYAFDPGRNVITACWPAGVGWRSDTVAQFSNGIDGDLAAELMQDLTALSESMWDTYVRPASGAVDENERAAREHERQRVESVVELVTHPPLPDESGTLVVSYVPVAYAGYRLGLTLHTIGDDALTLAVAAEVTAEVDALARAELGDLSGRAVQAVVLDRLDASPLQVDAAYELLRESPVDGARLLGAGVDPAAACVAAVHWLASAATVAAYAAGGKPTEVFARADEIHACSVTVPTTVVEQILDHDRTPRDVVLGRLRIAVAAGDGVIADLAGVLAERDALARKLNGKPPEQLQAALAAQPVRATPLDPRRPARDLLEHLLDGLRSCHLLYSEYAENESDERADESEEGSAAEAAADRRRREEITHEFAELLRDEAVNTLTRLS